jgi:cysteinyl-tRNA synthetase
MRLHDSLTRRPRELTASPDGVLRYYTCGPTIHDFAHVGNFRSFVWQDVLKRVMKARGFDVRHVMNITDVEDKIIQKAQEAGIDVVDPARIPDYTKQYEDALFEDFAALRIEPADEFPRATEWVEPMIELGERLVENGHAYAADGSLYFSVKSLPGYGRLSRLDPDSIRDGARVDKDEYEKDEVRDFVLWKAWREGEPRWESPWGPGRPGWHLECSAMSMRCLGADTIDLHAGGEDLLFPHHENEIAQSEGATGQTFCKHWVHGAHLRVEGEKMSKSLGNFFTLRDLVAKGHDPLAIRYLLASVHYRAPINLTEEALAAAAAALDRLNDFARRLAAAEPAERDDADAAERIESAARDYDAALDDDLNTSGALGALFVAVRETNAAIGENRAGESVLKAARHLLDQADAIFAFLPGEGGGPKVVEREIGGSPFAVTVVGDVPDETVDKVFARQEARKAKDFETSDRLRDELTAGGWTVEDAPGGAVIRA